MAKRSQVSNVPCELNEQAITQGQRRRGQPWLEVKPHIERKRKAVDAVVAEVGKFLYEAKLKSGVLPQVDFFEMMCKWEMIKCGGDYRQFYKWKFEMA